MYEPCREGKLPVTGESLVERKAIQDSILNQFWAVWLKEYVRNLPPATGSAKVSCISVGDLVLVREDNTPRLAWPVGVITEVLTGRDGIVRTCKIKLKGSEFVRPIQRLHRLELADSVPTESNDDLVDLDQPDDSQEQERTTDGNVRVTRYGRQIKPVKKLNL
jgi:hypothetical protein